MKLVVDKESLVSVADAIRTKGGTTEDLEFPQGFVDAVGAIESGGGTEEIITITTATTSTQEAYNIFSAFKNDNEKVILFVNTKTIDNMSINNLGMFAVLSGTSMSAAFGRFRGGTANFTFTVGANYDFVLPVGETFKKVVLF